MKIGFDNEKYLKIQSEHIKERIAQFDGKLYMELGGKLFDDHHASRVLPGFKPDSKLRMLAQLRDSIEIIIVVSAEDIEKNKVRADLGITYDEDVLRLRDEFMLRQFMVGSVVITHYNGQHAADQFRHRLEREASSHTSTTPLMVIHTMLSLSLLTKVLARMTTLRLPVHSSLLRPLVLEAARWQPV